MSELRENACSVPFQWWKVLLSTFETGAHGPTVFPPRKNQRMRTKFGTGGVIRIGCRKVAPHRRPPYHFIRPNSLVLVPASLYNNEQIPIPSISIRCLFLVCLFVKKTFDFFFLFSFSFFLFSSFHPFSAIISCVKAARILMRVRSVGGVCKWSPTSCVRFQKWFTDVKP